MLFSIKPEKLGAYLEAIPMFLPTTDASTIRLRRDEARSQRGAKIAQTRKQPGLLLLLHGLGSAVRQGLVER